MSQSNHSGQETGAAIVCRRCASINWESMVSMTDSSTIVAKLQFKDWKATQAGPIQCPVCQFLNKTWSYHGLSDDPANPLRFRGVKNSHNDIFLPLPFSNSSVHSATPTTHIILTTLEPHTAVKKLPYVYPDEVDYGLIKAWIRECQGQHGFYCGPRAFGDLSPLVNVIDCENRCVVPAPSDCAFVALSYVWGETNKHSQHIGILDRESKLPQTIEDSVFVATALGYRYLWVDRYCIDQKNTKNKHEQIQHMGAIYASAQITLVAAAGDNPEHGLPGVSKASRPSILTTKVRSVNLMLSPRARRMAEIFESPWITRAWTYQECYLSRRRLFFTPHQVVYVCNRGSSSEIRPFAPLGRIRQRLLDQRVSGDGLDALIPPLTLSETSGSLHASDTLLLAMRYLQEYSIRKLSYDTDALNAIVGALNILKKVGYPPAYHIWGVPMRMAKQEIAEPPSRHYFPGKEINNKNEFSIELAMYWYHESPARRRYDFPSWSPIGWEGPIHWAMNMIGKENKPVLAPAGNFRLGTGSDSRLLLHLINNDLLSSAHMPQCLDIQVMTTPLRLVGNSRKGPNTSSPVYEAWDHSCSSTKLCGYCVTSFYDEEEDNTFAVLWDVPSSTLIDGAPLQAIRFSKTWEDSVREMPIMIVRPVDNKRYERIGISWLPSSHEIFDRFCNPEGRYFTEETVILQ